MSHDNLSRGVPAQHLPENQDPDVQFSIDEVTGKITPLAAFLEVEEPAVAPKGKKRAATTATTTPAPIVAEEVVDAPGAGE